MSEYQYYEFCKINSPLTAEARKAMHSLSSRAQVGTHGASFVYNYGDFRGEPKELLLKYFDVFFYVSNFGSVRLIFKYSDLDIKASELKKHCISDVIECGHHGSHTLLDIDFHNEDGFGWVEGEGMLPNLLPLYDEIKSGNYQLLQLIGSINNSANAVNFAANPNFALSSAQEAFFEYAEIDPKIFYGK